ncbi:hypothetical protein RHAL1_01604 [Beijerinckiaceae bacterium RH AL1]|nr:hypothetical protein RHAL1_01604 [Beijerinckiaceae bacterium RH AL1]
MQHRRLEPAVGGGECQRGVPSLPAGRREEGSVRFSGSRERGGTAPHPTSLREATFSRKREKEVGAFSGKVESLDQSAHPRRFGHSREKCQGPARDVLGARHQLARSAHPRRQRRVARPAQPDGEGVAAPVEAHVGGHIGERRGAAVVDQEAELGRQRMQRRHLDEPRLERGDERADVGPVVQSGERARHHVAHGLGRGFAIDEAERPQRVDQRRQRGVAHAAHLQVGARREVELAVAVAGGEVGDRPRGRGGQDAAGRPHAHDQPVCRRHGLQHARAPALSQVAAHVAASMSARTAASELRRLVHRPRVAASRKRAAMARAASGFACWRKSRTSASPQVAAKSRSN